MRDESLDDVSSLAHAAGVDLGHEVEAVAERYRQLVGFARELDGLVEDDLEPDIAFEPGWGGPR